MVSKGQFVGLGWNRITRLRSQVMIGTQEVKNSLTASRCHLKAYPFIHIQTKFSNIETNLNSIFNIQYSASNSEGNRWVIGWLVIDYIRYSMSNRWIINRSQNFQSSISHWLIIDIVSQIGKPYHIENLKKQTSLTKMSRYTLFIPDLLSGRHSMVAAFLDKETDSNRQESKTDNSTFWIFCFWYFSYWCPIN